MPFYGNNLNYNRNFKKEFQYDNLKQRSSGLGFFVFAYSLTMTVSAMIVVEVFKAFGSAKYIYSDNYSILTYFMDIFISVFAVVVPAFFYIKLSRNSLNDIISTKYVKQKSMIPILFLGMGGAMIANVATSVIADNFSLFGIENTSSGLTIGDSSVLSIVLNIISSLLSEHCRFYQAVKECCPMLRHRLLPKSDLQRLYRQLQAHPSEQSEQSVPE